ncbi:MAG: VOC family protein [Acidimicrobiales bacterium]
MSATAITPYLSVDDAKAAIEWYGAVFGATVVEGEFYQEGDRIGHASLKIGSADLYVSDEYPELGAESPARLGGTTVAVVLHVDDVDGVWQAAVDAGATPDRPPADQMDFRSCWFRDPWGHRWSAMGAQPSAE